MTAPQLHHVASPFLSRTRRKLDEARFFLNKLENSDGHRPEFDYYLSAFLAAIRNVSWVIQSELRGPFRDGFDRWRADAKNRMPAMRIPFSVLTTLRNQSVKSGELLPGLTMAIDLRDGLGSLDLRLKTENGRIEVLNVEARFVRSPVILARPADADSEWPSPTFLSDAPDFWNAVAEALDGGEMKTVGYILDLDRDSLTLAEMIEGFRQHVGSMAAATDDAEHLFGSRK